MIFIMEKLSNFTYQHYVSILDLSFSSTNYAES